MARVVAVVRPQDVAMADLLRGLGCEVVACANAGDGMAASLVCGVQHARDANGWLIALADMPYVRPSTMTALAQVVGQAGGGAGRRADRGAGTTKASAATRSPSAAPTCKPCWRWPETRAPAAF
ncbi:NTP transferase domain-containing protein [Massilia eburnea]|uniref:NTP transferase domain-containing protein n=1 Tax=Massilia eburnea TaxID=1776165 RepID=UPI003D6A8C4F